MAKSRAHQLETHQEFVRNLSAAFGDAEIDELSGDDALRASRGPRRARASELADWNSQDLSLVTFLLEPETQRPIFAAKLNFRREIDTNDLRFARILARVFNEDVKTAPLFPAQKELWLSLQQTRFTRAIGRFSNFPTDTFVRWLRTFENASNLLYEGHLFAARLIMTKQVKYIEENQSITFMRFSNPIPLAEACSKKSGSVR